MDLHPRVKIITKTHKWDLIKFKSIFTAKETIKKKKKKKRQPTEWEKILANEATHRRLISKIHKDLMNFYAKKKSPNKNAQI